MDNDNVTMTKISFTFGDTTMFTPFLKITGKSVDEIKEIYRAFN